MRQFIRHPVKIPIEVSISSEDDMLHAFDLGMGGLAFRSPQRIHPGTLIHIKISHTAPVFETEAKVVWCRRRQYGAELGVEFLNSDDAFRARMVEQVCHIENYRQDIRQKEGRILTVQQAAAEWIAKYAASFPNPGSESMH